ncbi:MAG: TetR/AcrR family transcriptional regulator [Acidobacteriota bacterium]
MTLEPSADDPISTAARLREVATELFAERGYAGTSLAEIASRLGIRTPSLYNHTRSKDALFLDLFTEATAAWSDISRRALDGEGTSAERLERHMQASLGFATERPHIVGLCRVAVTQVGNELADDVEELIERQRIDYRQRLVSFFDEARANGEVVDRPTELLVSAWWVFLDGLLTQQIFAPPALRAEIEKHHGALWSLFWRGIAAEPSP